jgi:magnesium transporter
MRDTEEVVPLLQHPDDTAGGVMTPHYPVGRESISAGNALDELRFLSPDAEDISSMRYPPGSGPASCHGRGHCQS